MMMMILCASAFLCLSGSSSGPACSMKNRNWNKDAIAFNVQFILDYKNHERFNSTAANEWNMHGISSWESSQTHRQCCLILILCYWNIKQIEIIAAEYWPLIDWPLIYTSYNSKLSEECDRRKIASMLVRKVCLYVKVRSKRFLFI